MAAGVSVRDVFFAFDCETIDLGYKQIREDELLPLLESFSIGDFTRVENLILTVSAAPTCHLIFMDVRSSACDSRGTHLGIQQAS